MTMYGRVALVTGASRGIGAAVARAFAAAGASVVLAARSAEALNAVACDISTKALVVPTDVSSEASVAELFGAIADTFGRLDYARATTPQAVGAARHRSVRWTPQPGRPR